MSTKKDLMKYYSINLPELRALCKQKGIKGVDRKSNRQQMINAIIAHDKSNKNKPLHRRRSLPKHTPQTTPNTNKSNINSTSSNRRSRKRSRKDLNEDISNQPSDNDSQNKKRRKTNTPSTMTTPERNRNISQSPIRNPRIIPSNIQQKLVKKGYQAPSFINLLNDSSDDDIDIKDKNDKLTIVKASSPEDSDSEIESHKKNNNNNNNNVPFYNNNNESDSENDSDNSESESSNFDDGITPHKRVPNKRLLSTYDDNKSPSHSLLSNRKLHITSSIPKPSISGSYNITPQIPYKPKVQSQPLPYTISSPSHSRNIQDACIPFTRPMSHPPINNRNIHQVDNELNLQDDIRRIRVNNNNNKTNTFSIMNSIYNVIYCIKWPFIKLYQVIRFIFVYWWICVIVIVLIALLWSPTMKMMNKINIQDILQNIGVSSRDKYCDNLNSNITEINCKPCPKHAECVNGKLYCQGDRVFIKGKCQYDKATIAKLKNRMKSETEKLLGKRCGQFSCQNYYIYNYIYDIDNNKKINKALSENELKNKLATTLQLQSKSHLFSNVFEKFILGIKNTNKTIHLNDIQYDDDGQYYSTKAYKGIGCNLIVFFTDNCVWIIPLSIFMNVFIIWYIRRYIKMNKMFRDKQIANDRKDNVVMLLKNYQNNSNQRWIPIDQIKSQIMRDNNSGGDGKIEWVRVEKLVDRDANIQKSAQMVDGLQRLCWKLSDTALID